MESCCLPASFLMLPRRTSSLSPFIRSPRAAHRPARGRVKTCGDCLGILFHFFQSASGAAWRVGALIDDLLYDTVRGHILAAAAMISLTSRDISQSVIPSTSNITSRAAIAPSAAPSLEADSCGPRKEWLKQGSYIQNLPLIHGLNCFPSARPFSLPSPPTSFADNVIGFP